MDTTEKSKMQRFSFKALLDHYAVVVPMLQRDYAYGRKNEKEKRNNFLKKLKEYLDDEKPHELDFVYGGPDKDNNLKLLDGQQRITTLFLLHWYLSLGKDLDGNHHFDTFKAMMQRSDKKGESKFSYKTRFSSTDFCNMLVTLETTAEILEQPKNGSSKEPVAQKITFSFADKYSQLIADENVILSEVIKTEKWFLPHWRYDPTICGMLTMLDAIKAVFKTDGCAAYYRKLVENDHLVFNFLNLDDFQLTDELYIKMNSRGRPLTRFENLKSKLLPLYDEAKEKAGEAYRKKLEQLNLSADRAYTSLREYVSLMLDTKWVDMFWNEWLNTPERSEKPNVDDMMLSFISVLAINDHIIHQLGDSLSLARKDPLTKEINTLMSQKDKNRGITIEYDKLVALFQESNYDFLFKLIDYFNIFNHNGKLNSYYCAAFEKELFSHIANDYATDKMEYEWKARVFAYTRYLAQNPTPDKHKLEAWMRFVCNVCANSYTLPNGTDTFCTALAGINYLYCEDVKSEMPAKDLSKITAVLDISQIEEEILKIKLHNNENWRKAIDEAEERLEYFEGRLRYPLVDCCGVNEADNCNTAAVSRFNEYVTKIAAIFPDKAGCRCETSLIRALLAKGDYLMYFNSSNTFLKNAERDNSWRRYLKEQPSGSNAYRPYAEVTEDIRNYFREVIEDPLFDAKNVAASLETIAKARREDIPMWRKLVIDYPQVLDGTGVMSLGTDRFIRWNTDKTEHDRKSQDNYEIDLLQSKKIFGYHAELFSLCKYYDLQGKTFGGLGEAKYKTTKTSRDTPCFYFGPEEAPIVSVLYQDNGCFKFVFSDETVPAISNVHYADVETTLSAI